jgi:hypothetical protein
VNLSTAATALALSVALAGTLAAAPQAAKSTTTPPAKSTTATTPKSTAMKGEMVKTADLPKPVTDAVMKAHPKGEITMATKTMAGDVAWYALTIKDGAKTSHMTLDAMGKPKPSTKKK